MKSIAPILIFFFMTSLVMPTVVTIIKKDCARSIAFNPFEEEVKHKEYKVIAYNYFDGNTDANAFKKGINRDLISSGNLLKQDSITCNIFSPPPNFKIFV